MLKTKHNQNKIHKLTQNYSQSVSEQMCITLLLHSSVCFVTIAYLLMFVYFFRQFNVEKKNLNE